MNVTHRRHSAEFYQASKNAGGSIGTAGIVAEIFGELFFVAIRILKTGPDGYLRHFKGSVLIMMPVGGATASYFWYRAQISGFV